MSARTLCFPRRAQRSFAVQAAGFPALYVADDAFLKKISDYVHNGGHVLMTFKSGFTNENRRCAGKRPGPLRRSGRLQYQEFSNLEHPLALKGYL